MWVLQSWLTTTNSGRRSQPVQVHSTVEFGDDISMRGHTLHRNQDRITLDEKQRLASIDAVTEKNEKIYFMSLTISLV